MKKGLVVKSTGSWYSVKEGELVFPCRIKGKFRISGIKTTNPVTVGDRVSFQLLEDNTGLITAIDERKNYIIRRATRFNHESHLLASNIDQALLMFNIKMPETSLEFIDRFLATAEAYHIPSHLVINKIDLLNDSDKDKVSQIIDTYTKAGYLIWQISVLKDIGLVSIRELLEGKISLVSGNSGVGKSTFINKLVPGLKLKTDAISEANKSGKHTTTFAELITLNKNSYIIDTPGIRGFGLVDINLSELAHYFPEIFSISKNCKFNNCTHLHEPGCAVIDAVSVGNIGESRYKSYFNIMTENEEKYR